jgi:hypothetical protein
MHIFRLARIDRCMLAALSLAGAAMAAEPTRTVPTLRELSTDRPDSTESPFTVDAGHMQLELDVTSYTRTRLDGVKTTELAIAPFNVRYGITSNLEAGIFVVPYLRVTEKPRQGPGSRSTGIGDTTVRTKVNFWGNEGGGTALGIMADLKLPTAADGLGNDKTEGALTFPFAYELGAGWEGAGMTSVEYIHDGTKRRAVWVNTMTVAREIMPDVGGFLELTSAAGEGRHVATFNCGITRAVGPSTQLDLGLNIGISHTAPDLTIFAGFSRKF